MTPGELLAQREELKRLETDLELRYRKLQDFAQSQLGSMNDVMAASDGPDTKEGNLDFAKDLKSEDHHYSQFQLKQMEPPQSEQHGRKARQVLRDSGLHSVMLNRDHHNQSEVPSQPSARCDEASYTQNTQTGGRRSQERQ